MLIGNKKNNKSSIILDRSKYSINYALDKIKNSSIKPFVSKIYLYGSCARGEQTYKSDVDIFIEIKEDVDVRTIKNEIIRLKGVVSPIDSNYPEVDMKVVIGGDWKNNKMLYYKNVKKDGIVVWEQK